MSIQAELIDRVMDLSAKERAELARQLILSLEPAVGDDAAEVDAAWEPEIERRLAQVDRGDVQLLDWRESIGRIRDALKRPRMG